MDFTKLLNDKSKKPKEKTEELSKWIIDNRDKMNLIIDFAKISKDPIKATCIESIEFASKIEPEIASLDCLEFVTLTLTDKAPRIKWESAKVIANIAMLFPNNLKTAIDNLLLNSKHSGTVVRWSTAFALAEIIKLELDINSVLVPAIKKISETEEKNSIKKIYLSALKILRA